MCPMEQKRSISACLMKRICASCTTKSTVRRKRVHCTGTNSSCSWSTSLFCCLLLYQTQPPSRMCSLMAANAYLITWTNGPEDRYFCGMSWDQIPCETRQNCRTGKSEECEGFHRGEQCFSETACDSKTGGGHEFVSGLFNTTMPSQSPTGLGDRPSGPPNTVGPTLIPTEFPIQPPPPFEYPSDDPSDHWFCGVGIDDANAQCAVHCPSTSECPYGQVCYFGTICDARTHAPTPPPTRRPTMPPTSPPSIPPTITPRPTDEPTYTMPPSLPPSLPPPTPHPTNSPTVRPTHGPITAIQSGFFCGIDWNDAITNCKMRCPSGEDPECPIDEFCFAYTGCTEEKGYPDGPPVMRGDANATTVSSEQENSTSMEECISLQVTIIPDDWPQEISWAVTNEAGEEVVAGTNDDLVSGEPTVWNECIPAYECYEFTITDTGGDGICCEHGNGSYEVYFAKSEVKSGAAFYDNEKIEFGACGPTLAPTSSVSTDSPSQSTIESVLSLSRPTNDNGSTGISLGSVSFSSASDGTGSATTAYRCVSTELVNEGYEIQLELCSKFKDCYNKDIDLGDNWFCDDGQECIESPSCKTVGNTDKNEEEGGSKPIMDSQPPVSRPARPVIVTRVPRTPSPATNSPTTLISLEKTLAPISVASIPNRPRPQALSAVPTPVISERHTIEPSPEPTTTPFSVSPTLTPITSMPTMGPCSAEPCDDSDYCRSQHGYCGPGSLYCNVNSTWTKECETIQPTATPSSITDPMSKVPRPTGVGDKPSGGKKPVTPAAMSQVTLPPTQVATDFSTFAIDNLGTEITSTQPFITPSMSPSMSPSIIPSMSPSIIPSMSPSINPSMLPSMIPSVLPSILSTMSPQKFVTLSAEIKLDIVSKEPTSLTSEAVQTDNTLGDSMSTVATSDSECSGEPCEESTWCRTKYGSCGPGIIYCNKYSIWRSSCPTVAPGTSPSSSPTLKPVETSVDNDSVIDTSIAPIAAPGMSLPELPKPTLPTITDVSAFANTSKSQMHAVTADISQEETTHRNSTINPKEEKLKEQVGTSPDNSTIVTPEYVKQWTDWTASLRSGTSSRFSTNLSFAMILLAFIL